MKIHGEGLFEQGLGRPVFRGGKFDGAQYRIFANMFPRASKAAAGEILISEDSVKSGNLDVTGLESRVLELKGVSEPVSVRVMMAG